MKSPKIKGIGEVVTEYGAKVMKVIKKGLLGRSLFDFYGDIKANALRVKESSSVPLTPNDKDGGVVYVKNSDGKLYYKSNEVSEVELSAHTGLSTEEVQDIAGALVATGGTKTGIAVTYQDATGDVDFVIDHDAATNFVAAEHVDWAASGAGTIHTDNYVENVVQTTVTGSSGTVTSIGNLTGDVTSSNRATTIAADAVTYAKMQNVSATNVVLGRDSAGAGIVEEISAANLRTIINVEDGATADQTQADINGLAITTVGTIGTGVWQGTTIKTAYIGDDQITEDKLADTLLAEIDANTAKATNVSTNLTYTTGSDRITIVSSDGTNVVIAEASGSIAGVMTVAHHDKLDSIADNATADQTNVTGSSGSCTGNAATVTNGVYTSGNQTIADTKTFSSTLTYSGVNNHSLSLNNTSATGSPFISFNQNGSRKSFIQHNDTGDTIKIASEYGKISLQTGTGGAETAYLDIENDGVIRFGAVDADSVLTTDGNMTFRIDADNDETSQKFIFQNNASTEIASLNESGVLDLEGIVRPDITYVKILPSDFVPDDVGRPAMIDDTGSDRWLESHGTAKLFAYVDIPVGFKATHVDVYGSATSAVTVYEADVNSKTVTSKGTGNIGTQIDITDVNSDATNYILIELAQASGEEVYGGKLTIAKI